MKETAVQTENERAKTEIKLGTALLKACMDERKERDIAKYEIGQEFSAALGRLMISEWLGLPLSAEPNLTPDQKRFALDKSVNAVEGWREIKEKSKARVRDLLEDSKGEALNECDRLIEYTEEYIRAKAIEDGVRAALVPLDPLTPRNEIISIYHAMLEDAYEDRVALRRAHISKGSILIRIGLRDEGEAALEKANSIRLRDEEFIERNSKVKYRLARLCRSSFAPPAVK